MHHHSGLALYWDTFSELSHLSSLKVDNPSNILAHIITYMPSSLTSIQHQRIGPADIGIIPDIPLHHLHLCAREIIWDQTFIDAQHLNVHTLHLQGVDFKFNFTFVHHVSMIQLHHLILESLDIHSCMFHHLATSCPNLTHVEIITCNDDSKSYAECYHL